MRYEEKPSFKRTFKKLTSDKKEKTVQAIQSLINFYSSGKKTEGLGLKHLHKNIWEIRISLKDRVLFSLENDLVQFLIVGNHDDIRNYLKNY